jgi:hypothetical protein
VSDLPTREDWPAPVPAHGGDTREWPAARPWAPPPRSGMSGCTKALIAGVVATLALGTGACVAVVAAVDHAGREVRQSQARERLDVAAPACRVDVAGLMAAKARVTNHSSKRSNYLIRVTFEGADGGQLATSGTVVTALEPGQSTTATAHALQGPPEGGAFTCRVVTVERLSDEG